MSATARDLQALHYLAQRLRADTHGAGKWDDNGLQSILAKLEGQQLASVIERVTRHAGDPEAKTPGAINRPFVPEAAGERWQPRRGPWCGTCGQPTPDNGGRCADHDFELPADRKRPPDAIHQIVEEAKQRLEPTVAAPEPIEHEPDPRADQIREALSEGADA